MGNVMSNRGCQYIFSTWAFGRAGDHYDRRDDVTLATGVIVMALIPLAVGLLSAFVAYGGWHCDLRLQKAGRPLKLAS